MDSSLVYWSQAQALGLQTPHPSALSEPGLAFTLNLSLDWAGSGRAGGPGQRVLGWAGLSPQLN